MSQEFYTLEWKESRLHMNSANLPEDLQLKNGLLPTPWEINTALGSQESIWCAVFRTPDASGGVFVLQEDETILFTAQATTNMAFAQGMKMFAEMTSNISYATDIFYEDDNFDDDDDDDDDNTLF